MQNVWDEFECKLVKVVDKIVPLTNFVNKKAQTAFPSEIKPKINIRKRLLKQRKRHPTNELKQKLNSINTEIKSFYFTQKRNKLV